MIARPLSLIRHDLRLQYRYGIYAAYAVVVGFYVVTYVLLGPMLPRWALAVIVFSDPAAVAFFFLGALMMLEKSEGVRAALATSPVSAVDYLSAKTVTLAGLSLISSGALLLVIRDAANPALLLVTVGLTALQYVGIGVPIALKFRTVNGYLIGSAGFLTPVIAPGILALFEPFPPVLAVIPAASQLRLLLIATGAASATPLELTMMLAVSVIAAAAAIAWATRALMKELGK